MSTDVATKTLDGKTADEHRADAKRHYEREEESWQRSDTDGFVSQFVSGLNGQLANAKAAIIENDGLACFVGLYEGERRVKAKIVRFTSKFTGRRESKWLVHDDDPVCDRRKWIPVGFNSRVQKQLGLSERYELAPASAKIHGSGTGLSGLSTCHVINYRTGCEWGSDAQLELSDDEEAAILKAEIKGEEGELS